MTVECLEVFGNAGTGRVRESATPQYASCTCNCDF